MRKGIAIVLQAEETHQIWATATRIHLFRAHNDLWDYMSIWKTLGIKNWIIDQIQKRRNQYAH